MSSQPARSERGCERSDLPIKRAPVSPIDCGVDELYPGGGRTHRPRQLVGGLDPPIADPYCRRQILQPQSYRCTEESLEGAHVRWFALLQGGEDASTIIVGHH